MALMNAPIITDLYQSNSVISVRKELGRNYNWRKSSNFICHYLIRFMKLKLPPVLVFVIFSILMYVLSIVLPFGDFDFFGRQFLAFFLVGSGAIVGLVSLIQFYVVKTSIDPRTPSKVSSMVTKGLYKYSRNPMYLALLMVLLAWGLWWGNAFNTLLAAGFVGYMNRFQIIPEEEELAATYGKEFRHYCTQVRRWF